MKKIILALTIGFLLVSCSNIPDNSSSTSVYKWQFKLDGVLYKWKSGDSVLEDALNNYKSGNSLLSLKKGNLSLFISFPYSSTGNFVMNYSTWQSSVMTIMFEYTNMDFDIYETNGGNEDTNMNVNISYLNINDDPLNPGKAVGTFAGTIQNPDGNLSTITDGKFEVKASEY